MRPRELLPYVADEGWFRFNPRGIHGAPHTTRVLVWSEAIADRLGRPDALHREELRWAAAVHDVGRLDDGIDRGHGERSAAWTRKHLRAERPAALGVDLHIVADLCQWHEVRDQDIPHLTLELMILKDADALDRARLGDLDSRRLRLATSLRLVDAAARLERATNRYGEVGADDVLRAAERLVDATWAIGG